MIFNCSVAAISAEPLQETLPPLNNGKAPQNFNEMWQGFDPLAEPLDTEVLKVGEHEDVIIKVVRYRIGVFKGKKAMMAAVYGYPKNLPKGKKIPGLVNIHGGGQYASQNAIIANARRGYATISIAWAGRLATSKYHVSPAEVKLFWGNETKHPNYKLTTDWGAVDGYHHPSRDPKNAFPAIRVSDWTLDSVKSPRNNSWFLCALGARRAISFLQSQSHVDSERIGVYGHSMGGKLTVMTTAADKRVKASVPSCGGISDNFSKDPLFKNSISDTASLPNITCPILFLTPSNDFHSQINHVPMATKMVNTDQWRVSCSPNHNHQDTPQYEVTTMLWMDQHLKGTFTYPKNPRGKLTINPSNGVPSFSVSADDSNPQLPIVGIDVHYTQQGIINYEKDDRINTMHRHWQLGIPRSKTSNSLQAELPIYSKNKPLWVYANVTYKLPKPISGAGYYYGFYESDTFTITSVLEMKSAAVLKAMGAKATLLKTKLIEDFKDDWKKEWFSYNSKSWELMTNKVYHPAYRPSEADHLEITLSAEQDNIMVIGLGDYVAEIHVSGNQKQTTLSLSKNSFKNYSGQPLRSWSEIKQLKLSESIRIQGAKGQHRLVGQKWNGSPPVFSRLQWKTP